VYIVQLQLLVALSRLFCEDHNI